GPPVPGVAREPARATWPTRRERRGPWARPGAPRRTAKTAPAHHGRVGPSPPPGNGWLRNQSSSEETDETDLGTATQRSGGGRTAVATTPQHTAAHRSTPQHTERAAGGSAWA